MAPSRRLAVGFGAALTFVLSGCGHQEIPVDMSDLDHWRGVQKLKFENAIFFGHQNPDQDSVGSAFGAAELFGGSPACPMPRGRCPDAESTYLMNTFNIPLERMLQLGDVLDDTKKVVITDFNAPSQGPDAAWDNVDLVDDDGKWREGRVAGMIDHHIIQLPDLYQGTEIEEFRAELAGMLVETSVVGSTCTLVAEMYGYYQHPLSEDAARMLLGGVLSDTLNLRSPTTTERDRYILHSLATDAKLPEIGLTLDELWAGQRAAKSEAAISVPLLSAFQADMKSYSIGDDKALLIGSIRVFGEDFVANITGRPASELESALRSTINTFKQDSPEVADVALVIFLTDAYNFRSTFIMLGPASGAQRSVEACLTNDLLQWDDKSDCFETNNSWVEQGNVAMLEIGSCVSRKAEAQPALEYAANRWDAGEICGAAAATDAATAIV